MAQEYLKFNNYIPPTVDKDGYTVSFATTSTSTSGRTMRGIMQNTVLFTVEAYDLKWTNISAKDVSKILKEIVNKSGFNFHYYSIYKGEWRTDKFYVANINSPIVSLKSGQEKVKELSFQVTNINPI